MQEKSKRSLVFAVVAVFAVGSTIASAGFGGRARGKLAETQARMLPAGTSSLTPLVIPEYRLGQQDLEVARSTSDRSVAAGALVRVLERADRIDRGHSLAASVVAAKLFDGVAARVDADPALMNDARLVSALRRTSFASSRRPLEGERVAALTTLSKVPAQVPIRTAGFAESTTMQAMEDVNAALLEMQTSALAGDTTRCEEAAEKTNGLAKQVTVGRGICKMAGHVVESGHRLDRLRARARS
ncbi:MAG: hypothetical protein JWP87_2096 [Labilithrix sp.]|nr:hypothetical protein [Labilithrix sp.]